MKLLSMGPIDNHYDEDWFRELSSMNPDRDVSVAAVESLEELKAMLSANREELIVGRLFGDQQRSFALKAPGWIQVSAEASRVGIVDFFFSPPGSIECFADLALIEAFVEDLAKAEQGIDAEGRALIIGSDLEALGFCAAVSRLGIKRILLAADSDQGATQIAQIASKALFGSQFEAIPRAQLTQLPADCALAVCLLRTSSPDLIGDVSYVNFLSSGGVWLDWTGATEELGFGQDILSAGVRALNQLDIRRLRSRIIARRTQFNPEVIS